MREEQKTNSKFVTNSKADSVKSELSLTKREDFAP